MLTNFGKFCRKLRIDKGELLYDMAQRLKVSSAFLSKVENGKAKPPEEWKETITSMYSLDGEQKKESTTINVSAFSRDDRDMMFAFARKLDSMDEDAKKAWKGLLNM